MKTKTYISRILLYEGLGFAVSIALIWLTEFVDFSSYLGGPQTPFNWQESLLESLIVGIVAAPVMIFTKRLVSRLYYLEDFLRVCAWCKKLNDEGNWIPMENFFESRFHTKSSHGICPNCLEEINNSQIMRKPV